MIRVNKEMAMSPELLKKLIDNFNTTELPRMEKLERYYKGKNDILKRQMADPNKPNNKVANPYANYITDMLVGYFMGEPVSYTGDNVEELQAIFTYNDEQDENSELAKDASVYGMAYELSYLDGEGNVRFRRISPKEVVCVYDDTIEEDLLYVIRHYGNVNPLTDRVEHMIEVYSKQEVRTYKADDLYNNMILVDEQPHYFALVPFAVYKNNDDMIGDFELVVSLIDAYDKLESDSLNDFEYFVDSYLALYGMTADSEDIKAMKENRVMLLDVDSKAEWLTKNVNDANIENLKERLNEDIHKFSKCPAMTDKDFAGNASGVAMKYKLMGTENLTAIKERKFKKGLQRRLELIAVILGLKGAGMDWRSVNISFTRNLPANITEIADIIMKLKGTVSTETLLAQIPFIENPEEEAAKIQEEKELNSLTFFNEGGNVNGEATDADSGQDI